MRTETNTSRNHHTHVLLVEDEILISEWVAEELTEQGFVVYTAGNAREALDYLDTAPVDVLFTDINLEGDMDGTALARRARALHPNLMVVYASGRTNRLDPSVAVPGSVFVPKPYRPELVGPLLARAVRGAFGSIAERAIA
jgi:DNA-binding response OmpR family regulator